MLDSIFEADDEMAQDTSERSLNNNINSSDKHQLVMWFSGSRNEQKPCLSNAILISLEDGVRKLASSRFFKELELEKLLNLLKILERSIYNGEGIIVPASKLLKFDQQDIELNLLALDNTLKAIRVLFRIWLSGRAEKELLSEDLLTLVTEIVSKVIDSEILPLCEKELSSHHIMKFRNSFGGLTQELCRIFDHFSTFIASSTLNETSVTKLEFLTIKIVFQEVTPKQKDLIITPTNLESIKVSTMVLISTLFGHFPDQRSFILDEILSNFTKLTGTKSSRIYHCSDGTSVQLISALITRLIQTTGPTEKEYFNVQLDELNEQEMATKRKETVELCTKRISTASNNAGEILQYLISRAMKTTKSGDSPFRSLVEYFTEDFAKLIFSPEWPAAELLFSTLAMSLMNLLDNDKEGVAASTMALELLGNIESKLWGFKKHEDRIVELALNMSVLSFHGYSDIASHILYYIQSLIPKDPSALNAYQYFLSLFTSILGSIWNGTKEDDDAQELHEAVSKVIDQILANGKEGTWIDTSSVIDVAQTPRAAAEEKYMRFLYSRNLVQLYDRILSSILRSLNHSKINIRTKSLRVVSNLLAQSPDIFSMPQVQKSLSERIFDTSPQVRDAAVDIVGKYILMKPQFAKDFYMILCDRSNDRGLAVRKRVIRLLHELYLVVDDEKIKVEIAERIIRRIDDEERIISDLATQYLTGFFFPELKVKAGDIVDQYEQKKITSGVISVLERLWSRGEKNSRFLSNLFWKLFHSVKGTGSPEVKHTAKFIVENLAENASQSENTKTTEMYLGILSDFVGANGSFMTQDQLALLTSYIVDETPEAQTCCYYTLSIYHKSLDKVGPLRPQFLNEIQNILMKRLSKFNVRELCEGVPCLWQTSVMKGDVKKLAVVCISCLKTTEPSSRLARANKDASGDPKLLRLLYILGNVGRYCNIDSFLPLFSQFQPKEKAVTTVTELLINKIIVFTNSSQSLSIRKVAVKNICTICISHPLLFLSKSVLVLLDDVFNGDIEELKIVVIRSLIDFLNYEESTANEIAAMKNTKKPDDVDLGVFLGVTDKFLNDGASASLMQRYLNKIMEFSLSGETDFALAATILLERIINQGLANPRIAISTIIALEMSQHKEIATISRNMHIKLHDKHESLIDKSYVEGVRAAANYRIKVSSNLFMEFNDFSVFYHFLKTNRQGKRKFLLGLCRSLDFDPTEPNQELDTHMKYVVFVINAISTLNFYNLEEAQTVIYGLGKILGGTGVPITHSVEQILEKVDEADVETQKDEETDSIPATTKDFMPDISDILDVTAVDDIISVDTKKRSHRPSPESFSNNTETHQEKKKKIDSLVSSSEVAHITRSAVIIDAIWHLRQFIKGAYHQSEENCEEFDPSKLSKDSKPASRSTVQTFERLKLKNKIAKIGNSFDDNVILNITRLRDFFSHLSPESLNSDEYIDNDDSETTFISAPVSFSSSSNGRSFSRETQSPPTKRKRSNYGFSNDSYVSNDSNSQAYPRGSSSSKKARFNENDN